MNVLMSYRNNNMDAERCWQIHKKELEETVLQQQEIKTRYSRQIAELYQNRLFRTTLKQYLLEHPENILVDEYMITLAKEAGFERDIAHVYSDGNSNEIADYTESVSPMYDVDYDFYDDIDNLIFDELSGLCESERYQLHIPVSISGKEVGRMLNVIYHEIDWVSDQWAQVFRTNSKYKEAFDAYYKFLRDNKNDFNKAIQEYIDNK